MSTTSRQLLIIEDDLDFIDILSELLQDAGFHVLTAHTLQEALSQFQNHKVDLIILDITLNQEHDGIDVLKEVRKLSSLPVMIVSANAGPDDKVTALEAGADDYVTKPFDLKEFLARIDALLRRVQQYAPVPETVLEIGNLRLDLARRQVHHNNQPLDLTPTEFAILALLIQHKEATVTYTDLLHNVWGAGYVGDYSVLRVNISRLRTKLAASSAKISTIAKQGYRIEIKTSSKSSQ